jgi:hypothetical protein
VFDGRHDASYRGKEQTMKLRSALWLLAAYVMAVMAAGSTRPVWAQNDPGPLGVDVGVSPPASGSTAFTCQVGLRSLLTGEGIVLEKFSAEPGKQAQFTKTVKGLVVSAEVTISPGGSQVYYSITVTTTTHQPLGIYSALLKLHG